MITLYGNALSPFARKVHMALEYKGLSFHVVDGLASEGHKQLATVNPRVEVPVLLDGDLVVINSPHIIAYLEQRYPERPVYPADTAAQVSALAWERLADTVLDAILHAVANGGVGFAPGTMPPGLLDAAREDLATIFVDLERALAGRDFLCGALSLAELALFPHLTTLRFLDLTFDVATYPGLFAWYKRLRTLDVCRADLERAQALFRAGGANLPRPGRVVWRGDRVEWLLARGFHEWFFAEIRQGRAAWPRR